MLTQLGIIVALSILNGFFALSEIAVVASRKSRLKQLARTSTRARVALRLFQHPDRFLSAVQVGITLTVLLTGAFTGASLKDSVADALDATGLSWLAAHATIVGSVIGFILATFIQIVVGELVPKRIALIAPERLAANIAAPMLIVAKICTPFVWLLNAASTGLLKLLRFKPAHRDAVSEEEIRMLVAEGTEQGILDPDERNMVNRVLRLGDRNVGSVMTPRPRIAWLDIDAALEDNLAVVRRSNFSRYPVYRGDESDVVGIVELKRLIDSLLDGQPDLFGAILKPLYVPATVRALDMLDNLREADTRAALVVDEYGDIEGLVTLNDLLGAVIGQTSSAQEDAQALYRRNPDGTWLIDGALPVDDLRELLHLDHLPNEDEHEFHTVGGMIMTAFGRIPRQGETFAWHGLSFEVAALAGARINKVAVTPLSADTGKPQDL
jgi:putative hemolysin